MKRWSAVINYSRVSSKPPQTAEFDFYWALEAYLSPESDVIEITIYRNVPCSRAEYPASGPDPFASSVHSQKPGHQSQPRFVSGRAPAGWVRRALKQLKPPRLFGDLAQKHSALRFTFAAAGDGTPIPGAACD